MVVFRRLEEEEVSGTVPPSLGQEALRILVLVVVEEGSCMGKVELQEAARSMLVVVEAPVGSRILGKVGPRYTRRVLVEVGKADRPITVARNPAQASEEDIYRVGRSS